MQKIGFRDFWPNFDYKQHSAFNWIVENFNLQVTDDSPDVVVYSFFGNGPKGNEPFKKVFFTGERADPDFNKYDFAFTFEYLNDPRNFRFPLYLWHHGNYRLLENREKKDWASSKSKFCNFLYGNSNVNMQGVRDRIEFFKKLSEYKHVDSGGPVLNNIGYTVPDKNKWISDYKFTIAFENQYHSGYTTEKIMDPFISGSLPIYSGNPLINIDFNPDSFLSVSDFKSIDQAIERIIEIDQSNDLYNEIMNSRILPNPIPEWAKEDWYENCWKKILGI
jgi:hypothetical protein